MDLDPPVFLFPFLNDVWGVGAVLLECLLGVRWFARHWLPAEHDAARPAAAPPDADDADDGRQSFRSLEELYVREARAAPAPVFDADRPDASLPAFPASRPRPRGPATAPPPSPPGRQSRAPANARARRRYVAAVSASVASLDRTLAAVRASPAAAAFCAAALTVAAADRPRADALATHAWLTAALSAVTAHPSQP